MDLLQAAVLGLVQGLTEFIPVSSSGHLVLVPWYLGWPKPGLVFDTTLHLGTLVALLIYFWRDVGEIVFAWLNGWRSLRWSDPAGRMGWLIILATVPAAVLGLAFKDQFEALFAQPGFVGGALVATGFILTLSEWLGKRLVASERPGVRGATFVGFAQALAIVPGISRSGSTIAAGLLVGLTRPMAARFSFLLGMPIIAAAGLSQLWAVFDGSEASPGAVPLAVGFVAAAVSGYLCIRFLLAYLRRGTLNVFAVYCWVLGTVTIATWLATGGNGLG